ncbi:MAG: inositol monophosphatase [Bacteroidales bacterium]|jgi:myo-inositol-1(or 4)-monophosphatase|nr:inositol monophosphatase [Bacteroidales bacterium]
MEPEKILNYVIRTAKDAGNIIRNNIGKISASDIEKKGLNDFVTTIDKESESLIIRSLKKLLPEAGFIAEENDTLKTEKEYNWIIDPLDGTTNFIHSFFPCAVSIGLQKNDEIILGVVYEIGFDECFYAYKNGGAYLNGNRINVSDKKNFSDSLLATGFPYHEFNRLDKYIELLKFLTENTQGIRRLGSAATDLAYVACGRFDGFYEYDLKPYDVAAGIIIVKEAGGKISDFKGTDNYLFGKEIVASNKLIFEDFITIVNNFMNNR